MSLYIIIPYFYTARQLYICSVDVYRIEASHYTYVNVFALLQYTILATEIKVQKKPYAQLATIHHLYRLGIV